MLMFVECMNEMHFQLLHTYTTGIGSCKWQTHHSHQSGRQGREKEFQTTGLSPVQPIHFPSLGKHPSHTYLDLDPQYVLHSRKHRICLCCVGVMRNAMSISFVQNHTQLMAVLVRILRMTFPHSLE